MLLHFYSSFWTHSQSDFVENGLHCDDDDQNDGTFAADWVPELEEDGEREVDGKNDGNYGGISESDSEVTVDGEEAKENAIAVDAGTKKRRRMEICQAARDARKRIKIADGELRAQFFEGKVAAAESTDDEDGKMLKSCLYRVAMERLDEGFPWILKNVSACAAISEKTLRSYHIVWKKLAVSNPSDRLQIFEYYVDHKK